MNDKMLIEQLTSSVEGEGNRHPEYAIILLRLIWEGERSLLWGKTRSAASTKCKRECH